MSKQDFQKVFEKNIRKYTKIKMNDDKVYEGFIIKVNDENVYLAVPKVEKVKGIVKISNHYFPTRDFWRVVLPLELMTGLLLF